MMQFFKRLTCFVLGHTLKWRVPLLREWGQCTRCGEEHPL